MELRAYIRCQQIDGVVLEKFPDALCVRVRMGQLMDRLVKELTSQITQHDWF